MGGWVGCLGVGWKSRLIVSFLGNHSWSRTDTGSEEGSHYKYRVLTQSRLIPQGSACQLSRQKTVYARVWPSAPETRLLSASPAAMGNSYCSRLPGLSQSRNSSRLGEPASHCPPERLGRDSVLWKRTSLLKRQHPSPPLQLSFWPASSPVEVGRRSEDCPSILSSASVCLCNVRWCQYTKGREAHTHPELLLVRDSLSVCPRPSLSRVSVL